MYLIVSYCEKYYFACRCFFDLLFFLDRFLDFPPVFSKTVSIKSCFITPLHI
jgi:hypothetical protein